MLKAAIRKTTGAGRSFNAVRFVRSLHNDRYIHKNIPYQCQFASPSLVEEILDGRLSAADDPNWENFGYSTADDAGYWAPRQCGIACTKMLVDHYSTSRPSVAKLTKECVELGGYDTQTDTGWYYKPLLRLLNKYDMRGHVAPHMTASEIVKLLKNDRLFIASVNPQLIRGDTNVSSRDKSGHLVLVLGYNVMNGRIQGFYIHNPSGKSEAMRSYAYIPIKQFREAYGQKGIVVYK